MLYLDLPGAVLFETWEGSLGLRVSGNGTPLPAEFNPEGSSSLGLTLVLSLPGRPQETPEFTNSRGRGVIVFFPL
ncbi:MAG: hypothetical protein ACOC47_05540 [Alkalispirochaetaceae bacterium]